MPLSTQQLHDRQIIQSCQGRFRRIAYNYFRNHPNLDNTNINAAVDAMIAGGSRTPRNLIFNFCESLAVALNREFATSNSTTSIPTTTPINDSSINLNDFDSTLTFGIEIEFLTPRNVSMSSLTDQFNSSGLHTRFEAYNHDEHHRNTSGLCTRTYWKFTTDSSVTSLHPNFQGGNELVSPVLKGYEGLRQVQIACKILKETGCKVNIKCGFHVHHGCKHIFGNQAEQVGKNAVILYSKYQAKFNRMMPKSRRNNYYAKSYKPHEIRDLRYRFQCGQRYKVVNIQSYWRHGTMEFRQHSGTLEFPKILNWIKITQKIMVRAKALLTDDIWAHEFKRFEAEFNFCNELKTYIKDRYAKFADMAPDPETETQAA